MKWSYLVLLTNLAWGIIEGGTFTAKNYDYLFDKMPKLNATMLELHIKLYQGYVEQTNALEKLLAESLETNEGGKSFTYQSIKRRYGWEYNGMRLHELYFDNLGGKGNPLSKSPLYQKIVDQYGSFQNWMAEFKATCQERGVGWVILYYDPKSDRLTNAWIEEHNVGLLADQKPLLVVDLWEHAYLCQYKLDRQKYVDVIFGYLDWNVISSRFQ